MKCFFVQYFTDIIKCFKLHLIGYDKPMKAFYSTLNKMLLIQVETNFW